MLLTLLVDPIITYVSVLLGIDESKIRVENETISVISPPPLAVEFKTTTPYLPPKLPKQPLSFKAVVKPSAHVVHEIVTNDESKTNTVVSLFPSDASKSI